jgi:hypothetical protein
MAPLTSSRTISRCWGAALDDLDAAVLRLADAVGRRDPQVVLAASGDHESVLRHPVVHQHARDGVGPALGQSLVVIGRARGVGIPGDLQVTGDPARWAFAACPIISRPPGPTTALFQSKRPGTRAAEAVAGVQWQRAEAAAACKPQSSAVRGTRIGVSSVPPTVEERRFRGKCGKETRAICFSRSSHLGCSRKWNRSTGWPPSSAGSSCARQNTDWHSVREGRSGQSSSRPERTRRHR